MGGVNDRTVMMYVENVAVLAMYRKRAVHQPESIAFFSFIRYYSMYVSPVLLVSRPGLPQEVAQTTPERNSLIVIIFYTCLIIYLDGAFHEKLNLRT